MTVRGRRWGTVAKVYAEGFDDDLKRMMDADPRSLKEILESGAWREMGGKRKSALEAQKEQKELRREAVENEIKVLKEERAKLTQEIEELDEEIASIDDQPSYEDDVENLFNEFANSRAVLPRFRTDAQDIADEHDKTLAEIEQDLHDLADESDYEIPDDRWTDRMGSGLE